MNGTLFITVMSVMLPGALLSSMNVDETRTTVSLSDGRKMELQIRREGTCQWFQSDEGFAIVQTPVHYEYAFEADDGGLAASGVMPGASSMKLPFPPGIRPTPEFLRQKRAAGGPPGSPPSPHPVLVTQPNGSRLELYLKGSSGVSWYEDKSGYTILSVPGRLEYAVRNSNGELVGCGIEIGSMPPAETGLVPRIRPSDQFLKKMNALEPQ